MFLGHANSVKGYCLWDPIVHKIIVSRDVIFVDNELQREVSDRIFNVTIETTIVKVENKSEQEDSSIIAIEHEEQEPIGIEASIICRSTCQRKLPTWYSDYVTEGNCPPTEDGEPSTFCEAINSQNILRGW